MVSSQFKQFVAMKNWNAEKNIAYGEENGYLFTLVDGQGTKIFASPLPSTEEYAKKEILEYLKENKKTLKINEFSFDNDVLIVKFKEQIRNTKAETMDNFLKDLTGFLKSKSINGKGYCIFCGNDNAEQKIYIDNIMYSAHNECYSHEIAAVEEAAKEYEEEDKNYVRGFVGALIGGIMSSIPWILVRVYLNRLAAVLAILIGIGSLKAYYMFKGKLGRATRWIVASCTLISVVFAQFGATAVEMAKNSIPVNYNYFVRVLNIPEAARAFRANFILSLIMAFLGIIPVFLQLKGDTKSVMPDVKKK